MSRIPLLAPDRQDREQAALYAEITGGPRAAGPQHFALVDDAGALRGPFNALLLSPRVGRAQQALGSAIRFETRLSARARELAILVVAAAWDSAFERASHEAVGRAAGLTDDELAAVRDAAPLALADEGEAATVALCRALCAGDVDDALWERVQPVLGDAVVFELTALVGYYAALALQLRVFRVEA